MSKIYLVQSASDLGGAAGYCKGLLEAEVKTILVSFLDYRSGRQTILPSSVLTGEPPVTRKKSSKKKSEWPF